MPDDAYIGDIQAFPYGFVPRNWAACEGQLIAISQNTALFSILGNTYGGDGRTTFGLPDLRGRLPIHVDSSMTQGQGIGAESVTLTKAQASHALAVDSSATTSRPTNATPARGGAYAVPATAEGPSIGNSLPHENRQPYLALTFCICLFGVYPPRN